MKRILAALVLLAAPPASAQVASWEHAMLPLKFAQASPQLLEQFAREWDGSAEQKYCITAWQVGTTKDMDTVYVATEAYRQDTRSTRVQVVEHPECQNGAGQYLPTAHTHLTGDCTPSRADRTEAVSRRSLFDLIVCGRGVTSGYVWTNFRIATGGGG